MAHPIVEVVFFFSLLNGRYPLFSIYKTIWGILGGWRMLVLKTGYSLLGEDTCVTYLSKDINVWAYSDVGSMESMRPRIPSCGHQLQKTEKSI